MVSPVVQEIKRQLIAQNVDLRKKILVAMDDKTLRVHSPGKIGKRGGKSIDISYNPGTDYYDLKIHKIEKDFSVKTKKFDGVAFDSLPVFFDKEMRKKLKKYGVDV